MPITRELILTHGIVRLSSWVKIFQSGLAPWNGRFSYLQGQDWEQGPSLPELYVFFFSQTNVFYSNYDMIQFLCYSSEGCEVCRHPDDHNDFDVIEEDSE
jgi:hypothetical protein